MTNMKIFVFSAALIVLILHCVTGKPTRSDSEAQNQSLKGFKEKTKSIQENGQAIEGFEDQDMLKVRQKRQGYDYDYYDDYDDYRDINYRKFEDQDMLKVRQKRDYDPYNEYVPICCEYDEYGECDDYC